MDKKENRDVTTKPILIMFYFYGGKIMFKTNGMDFNDGVWTKEINVRNFYTEKLHSL